MIVRRIKDKATYLLEKYPVLTITGPRQSGKTTLSKTLLPDHPYINLEEPDIRSIAQNDPRGFITQFEKGAVLDEIQRVPELFSYIQSIVDENPQSKFILSGSQNFLLMESITQSLAGRTAILKLLPLSMTELKAENKINEDLWTNIHNGFYPRMYDKNIAAQDFFPYYIQTYVERDVRLIVNLGDINGFIGFVKLCAGRIGQLINYASLANDAGVSPNTAKNWVSVLEASYIIYRIQPFHKNYNKRITKQNKLYFYDTGLACSLLNIQSSEQLKGHYLKGGLFENFVITEIIKSYFNNGKEHDLYFWRDNKGKEIDCIIDTPTQAIPVEIKSGETMNASYFDNIQYWNKLSENTTENSFALYAGNRTMNLSFGKLLSWQDMDQLYYVED